MSTEINMILSSNTPITFDSKKLPTNTSYNELPDYFSVTILSYDPFGAGDMYYEVRSVITTHPKIEYMDGIMRIFLYCKGKNNLSERKEYGERLQEVLEYIVDGAVRENPSRIVTQMNDIVTETKERAEVTERYMQKWDELEHIKRDLRSAMADDVRREVIEEVRQEVTEEVTAKAYKKSAKELIDYGRLLGDSEENIRKRIVEKYDFDDKTIEELLVR
ncbi:hypothetical protein [Butyrivibrio sp. AE3009]|uniref:hypothetical protein n=1 Tax=Butyrivibrio sp. AE3009 TaxID=1280666 RepID=UPI0003B5EE2D|nr:hypothetical protein [Butyrivibrio sp. AE3009]